MVLLLQSTNSFTCGNNSNSLEFPCRNMNWLIGITIYFADVCFDEDISNSRFAYQYNDLQNNFTFGYSTNIHHRVSS